MLADLDLTSSMGRTGVCWDNAIAESFFSALKNELVYRTVFPTRKHARRAIVEYIEVFYNRQRLHSGLGYTTPEEAYQAHLDAQLSAQKTRLTTVQKTRGRPRTSCANRV